MSENKIEASVRTSFGKGAARQLRRAGKTPAVIYGHGTDPQHVALPSHELGLAVRHANALLDLDVEGTQVLVLVKDVQRNPVQQVVEHVDLIVVNRGEKVEVDVPVVIEGDPIGGTMAIQDLGTVSLLVSATAIPQHVVVSVEGVEDGFTLHANELELPEGAELLTEADALVVAVHAPTTATEDADGDQGEAEEPAAE